jgi:hypothetical protein
MEPRLASLLEQPVEERAKKGPGRPRDPAFQRVIEAALALGDVDTGEHDDSAFDRAVGRLRKAVDHYGEVHFGRPRRRTVSSGRERGEANAQATEICARVPR